MDKLEELKGQVQEKQCDYDAYSKECAELLQRITYIVRSTVLDGSDSYMKDKLYDLEETIKSKQSHACAKWDALQDIVKKINKLGSKD